MQRKCTSRLLSLMLVVALLVQLLPVQAFATEESNAAEPEQSEAMIVGEIESLRSEQTKHFKLSDGSNIAVSYGRAVHYRDQNGAWLDIDNRPVMASSADGDGAYQISNGTISSSFAPSLSDGELFTSTNNGASVTTYLLDTSTAVSMTEEESISASSNAQLHNLMSEESHLEFDRNASAELSCDTPTFLEADSAAAWQTTEILPENLQSSLLYEDVYPGVDILYTIIGYDVKEDIIIRQPQNAYRFDFFLRLNGLTAVLNDDGSVSLRDEDLDALYYIPVPYMTDAAGEISYDVDYLLTEINGGVILTVVADEAWFEDEGRSFPVTIDPTLKAEVKRQYVSENSDIYAVYVKESQPDLKPGLLEYLYTGSSAASNGMEFETFLYINNLPVIPAGCIVTDALLKLVMYEYSSAGCSKMPIGVYEVTGENPREDGDYYKWFAEMSWNTKPDYDEDNVIDYVTLSSALNEHYISWDITKVVKEWYRDNESNRVLALGAVLDHYSSSSSAAQSYAACGQYNTPLLVVSYRSNTGIESYYTYQTMGAGNAGSAYISDVSGQLKVVTPLVGYASTVSPFSLNAVYNSDYFSGGYSEDYSPTEALGLTMSMGSGWTLDCIQGLVPETIESVEYLKYYDGDGTVHYFKRSYVDYNYYDEDGLGLMIKLKHVTNSKYEMTDDHGNTWYFQKGLLVSTKDANKNVYTFNYASGKLTSIVQTNAGGSAITVASFAYNDEDNTLQSITDAGGNTLSFHYIGTDLTSITYQTGSTASSNEALELASFEYSSHRLTKMTDSESDYQLAFSYSNDGRISHFAEQAGNQTGAKVDVSYSNGKTTYLSDGIDRNLGSQDDISTHYLFDHAGHTVNVYTTDAAGTVLGASNAAYNPTSSTSRLNNHIDRTGSIGVAAVQLLRNSSFEAEGTSPWALVGGSAVSDNPRTGLKSFTGSNGSAASYELSSLAANTTYTFSGYVNIPTANSGITFEVTDSTDTVLASDSVNYVTTLNQDDPWVRISVTFTTSERGTYKLNVKTSGTATVYADDFQLELGEAPSNYNLLGNGSLEMTPSGWTLGTGASVDTTLGVISSTSAIKIVGDPMSTATTAYQDISLNRPSTETYVLSGWAKATAAPDTLTTADDEAQDMNKQFGLRAILTYTDDTTEYHYIPFNPELEDWQFTSCVIVPHPTDEDGNPVVKTVASIRIICAYETNINTAWFDNISLVREVTQTMKYDDDGNLVSVTTSGLNVDINTYDGGNLIQTVTGGQGIFQYEYYSTYKHRLKSVTQKDSSDAENAGNNWIKQSMEYDGFGNVTSTTLSSSGNLTMSTSAEYINNGNLLSSVTDAAGATVTYGYDSYGDTTATNSLMWGLPTSVTAPNGVTTSSAYDLYGRVTQTSVANLATLQYNYSNGNLSAITRTASGESQTYTFQYDSFGKSTSISVGSRVLAAYEYMAGNGLLTKQTYGNGHVVTFTYDNLGRTKTVTHANGLTLSYTYTGEGQLHSVTETQDGVITLYLYQYDTLGNLVGSEKRVDGSPVLRTYHSYDTDNRLSAQGWQIGTDTYTETYAYDTWDGNLSSMQSAAGQTLTYGYDSLRRLTTVDTSLYEKAYTYQNLEGNRTTGQVTSVTYDLPEDQTFGYTYDSMGNIATYTDASGTVTYTYDDLGQLTQAVHGETTCAYTYDNAGNILSGNGHSYTYGDTQGWVDLLTAVDDETISYDAIGNPTSYYNGTRWAFTWTQGRNLATAGDGTNSISYTYDGDGLRTSKTVNGTEHTYYYAGGKLLRETYGTTTLDFFYDAAGNAYALKHNGTLYYYITNLQGDVMSIVDGTGTVVASYQYDPYGNVLTATGNLAEINPLRYRGYYFDSETTLYYLQSRYYDPEMGRFLNCDVVFDLDAGLQGFNLLVYCGNNPVCRTDISGMDSVADLDPDETIEEKIVEGGGGAQPINYVGDSTTTLYRSVGQNEANDIRQTGRFNLSPKGMESKQFGYSYDETSQFGRFVGQSIIVSVKVPTSLLEYFDSTQVDKVIFKHGTLTVYGELLDFFNQIIIGAIDFWE